MVGTAVLLWLVVLLFCSYTYVVSQSVHEDVLLSFCQEALHARDDDARTNERPCAGACKRSPCPWWRLKMTTKLEITNKSAAANTCLPMRLHHYLPPRRRHSDHLTFIARWRATGILAVLPRWADVIVVANSQPTHRLKNIHQHHERTTDCNQQQQTRFGAQIVEASEREIRNQLLFITTANDNIPYLGKNQLLPRGVFLS
jgi:hypothetical protein